MTPEDIELLMRRASLERLRFIANKAVFEDALPETERIHLSYGALFWSQRFLLAEAMAAANNTGLVQSVLMQEHDTFIVLELQKIGVDVHDPQLTFENVTQLTKSYRDWLADSPPFKPFLFLHATRIALESYFMEGQTRDEWECMDATQQMQTCHTWAVSEIEQLMSPSEAAPEPIDQEYAKRLRDFLFCEVLRGREALRTDSLTTGHLIVRIAVVRTAMEERAYTELDEKELGQALLTALSHLEMFTLAFEKHLGINENFFWPLDPETTLKR